MKLTIFFLFLSLQCGAQCHRCEFTKKYKIIPDNKIPSCGFTLFGSRLIDLKTDSIIGKQWHDFGDGSVPGIYWIIIPTAWEKKRHDKEVADMAKRGIKYLTRQEYEEMIKDTTRIFFTN